MSISYVCALEADVTCNVMHSCTLSTQHAPSRNIIYVRCSCPYTMCCRDRYTADMKFLEVVYWEKFILADHIAHDAFCCVLLDGVRTDIKRENRK